jgi:hypothetical protein
VSEPIVMPATIDPAVIAKSVHASLDAALAAIPVGHTHALLFDGRYADDTGPVVQAVYVEKAPHGWQIALSGGYSGTHGVLGQVEIAKSW